MHHAYVFILIEYSFLEPDEEELRWVENIRDFLFAQWKSAKLLFTFALRFR